MLAIVYNGDEAIHAGRINSDGTYDAKGGTREIVRGMTSEAQFLQPYGTNDGDPDYSEGTRVVYYK